MSLRSRSASPSGSSGSSYASSSDSESEDDSSQLLEAARKAAALKAGAANDAFARQEDQLTFSARPHTSSLQQEPQLQPVASTSKAVANTSQSASTDPPDQFGQLPRKHLSKKAYNAKQPKSAGNNWFHMPAAPKEPSEALKREVAALKLGAAIDPKRFLRGEAKRDAGKLPEYFQVCIHSMACMRACYNLLHAQLNMLLLLLLHRWVTSWPATTQHPRNDEVQGKPAKSALSSTRLQKTNKSECVVSQSLRIRPGPALSIYTDTRHLCMSAGLHQAQVRRSPAQDVFWRQELLQVQTEQKDRRQEWHQEKVVVHAVHSCQRQERRTFNFFVIFFALLYSVIAYNACLYRHRAAFECFCPQHEGPVRL